MKTIIFSLFRVQNYVSQKNIKYQNFKKEEFLMADKTLVCKDCGAEFVFTEGEQAF